MKSRALFVDFDGVFHPARDVADYASGALPSVPLKQFSKERNLLRWTSILADILNGHEDVMLIVHSGWRTRCQAYELREFLGPLGEQFNGVTENGSRYRKIMELVDRAQFDDYLILDDAVNEFPAECAELVACDPAIGITDSGVQARIKTWLES